MAASERSKEGAPDAPRNPRTGSSRSTPTSVTVALTSGNSGTEDPGRSAAIWSPLAAVRAASDEIFAGLDADVLDAIRMAAGELGENVLKYGEPVDGVAGYVTLSRTGDRVEIRTVNRLTDPTEVVELSERIVRVAQSEDLRGQFVERMTQIVQEPNQHSTALGLVRVGYEGSFELSASHANATMTIIAARRIR